MPTVSTSTRNEPRATSTGTASTVSVRLSRRKTRMIWRRPSRMWNGSSTRPTTRPLWKARTSATPRSGTQSATAPFLTCCPAARPARKRPSTNWERWMNTLRRRILLNIVTEFIEEFKAKFGDTCSCAGLGVASG
ncbi:MAG: hypothetical protein ACLVJH_09940 [Faecalibacterium prausnitzii]